MFISAAHKSSGKTIISLGLGRLLAERVGSLQVFKKGPDYIDPIWLRLAAGKACYNLDFNTASAANILRFFQQRSIDATHVLIEGNKGLHDGVELDGSNSNAALAKLLQRPVVLVVDSRGMTRGVAPLVLGIRQFDADIRFGGVILNRVGGPRHEAKLIEAIEYYTDLPVLGAVRNHQSLDVTERHLGLVPGNEIDDAERMINGIASVLKDSVDLETIESLAAYVATRQPEKKTVTRPNYAGLRIGIAEDAAFGFYYADDLEAMAQTGAELLPFSPLQDTELPAVDALLIGGGFPETHLRKLADNLAMKQAIQHFIDRGGIVYAECGGLMYLARSIVWHGECAAMVGALDCDCEMHDKPQGRGYITLEPGAMMPWQTDAALIKAHEFHYSSVSNLGEQQFAFKVTRGFGMDGRHDGCVKGNVFAGYAHLRNSDHFRWTDAFLAHITRIRQLSNEENKA